MMPQVQNLKIRSTEGGEPADGYVDAALGIVRTPQGYAL